MAKDRSVISVLATALEKDPDNVELRAHLASLLLEEGEAQDALKHCTVVLSVQPDHLGALNYAARAAAALGDSQRANAYRRLSLSLSGQPEEPMPKGLNGLAETLRFEEKTVSGRMPEASAEGRVP